MARVRFNFNLNPIVKEEKQKDEKMEEKLSITLKN